MLKKSDADKNELKNSHRPVSNLPLLSKLLEKVAQTCSVPQGSVLGPLLLLLLLYTAELAELAARYGVTLHSFADNNQLHIHCRIDDVHLPVADLERCVTAIGHWMSANRLKTPTKRS